MKDNEAIVNSLSKQKSTGPDGFNGELYQVFREEMIPILYSLLQKVEVEEMLLKPFCKVSIILILKLDKGKKDNGETKFCPNRDEKFSTKR